MADHSSRALPLLSGIAPRLDSASSDPNCHRCSREFGMLTRRKICNHCGFAYCGSCCDHQALCPRSDAGYRPGYETVLVCTYCIDMLSITACGKSQLRGMPVGRLRNYLEAYGIKPKSAIEKDDLIEAIIDARGLNGCLSYEQEHFYRRQTIAKRAPIEGRHRTNIFSSNPTRGSGPVPPPRPRSTDPRVQSQARSPQASRPPVPPTRGSDPYRAADPYLQQNLPQQNSHNQRPMSPRQERPPPANTTWSPPRSPQPRSPIPHYGPTNPLNVPWSNSTTSRSSTPHHSGGQNTNSNPYATPPPQPRWQTRPQSPPPQPPPDHSRPASSRSRSRSVSEGQQIPAQQRQQAPPPPPPPTSSRPRAPTIPALASLLDKTREEIGGLTVMTLKGILQANHVNARLILEKNELVDKVMILIEMERRERAREQAIHEAEERAAIEQQRQRMEQLRMDAERRANASASGGYHSPPHAPASPSARSTSPRPAPAPTAFVEREGLCVVCQDEEANVAVVDCGHLCLCMSCSDTIMKSTRECPLCRTRIVTEQRLLRIFKS
ncbi:hypothetical protein M408DRAFT_331884 [Serendipita vermifera MAFF 305830]|uniref:RING-type domain-containing protein n=1 Tax=Serendipita vermifera MAFF 305830 TaxID=933852 RepID=A0A0C3AYE2_SERVB|nr:hypothetical protein M408DRAFT_331884 [Serendipita vermifera MAFF 305830]